MNTTTNKLKYFTGAWGRGANESPQKKVAPYGPGIIFGAKNNFQKVTQFGFILFSVLIYYRGLINYFFRLCASPPLFAVSE